LEKIKVFIADDNNFFRKILKLVLLKYPEFSVIGESDNGIDAYENIMRVTPDIVLLDNEMPGKNGIDVLKDLKIHKLACQTIMISAKDKSDKNVDLTINCLMEGAFDFIRKPKSISFEDNVKELEETLIIKMRLAQSKNLLKNKISKLPPSLKKTIAVKVKFQLPIKLVAIGISTGGPGALETLLKMMPPGFEVPIVIIQHMPPNFTLSLAKRLNSVCTLNVQELNEGTVLKKRNVYIAPGGKHTILRKSPLTNEFFFSFKDIPPVNHCKPSVDVFYFSLCNHTNNDMIALIMTGMGNDGVNGLKNLKEKKAYIIAQDEETSTVWGMPGAAVEAGVTDEVLPLDKIAGRLDELCG